MLRLLVLANPCHLSYSAAQPFLECGEDFSHFQGRRLAANPQWWFPVLREGENSKEKSKELFPGSLVSLENILVTLAIQGHTPCVFQGS